MKRLNEAKVNANHAHHEPYTPVSRKAAVSTWPEEELMEKTYVDARKIYTNVMLH